EPGDPVAMRPIGELPGERAHRAAELDRTPGLVALPERHLAVLAGSGGHEYPVACDVLDPPARRPEQEDLAASRLVHHLLVELAYARSIGEEHAEQAPVGDRSSAGHGE